jgi:hypothetical protein
MTGMFCKRIAMAVVAGFGLALALPADAANPPVIERLSKEPTTLFDSGMKRLRLFALEAATRIAPRSSPVLTTRVWYKADTGTIEIRYVFRTPTDTPSTKQCQALHVQAVNEVFSVETLSYSANISPREGVIRRLGLIFAHEPIESGNEAIAVGERLSEITFLEIVYIDAQGEVTQSCRSDVATRPRQ